MTSGGDEGMIEWMKYAEIQVLKQKGFKKARVAKMLHINRETVAKYWEKPPDLFENERSPHRARKLDIYKELIVEWLTQYPDMTAAQIYDWCKERSPLETLDFQKRSFQDYVNSIRKEYGIKKPETSRQYEASDEREPGAQGQVDMGEIYVPTQSGRNKKISYLRFDFWHDDYYQPWRSNKFANNKAFAQKYFNYIPEAKKTMREFVMHVLYYKCVYTWSDARFLEFTDEDAYFARQIPQEAGIQFLSPEEMTRIPDTFYLKKTTDELEEDPIYAKKLSSLAGPQHKGCIFISSPEGRLYAKESFLFIMMKYYKGGLV